jgi:hypothetical protein
MSKENKDKTKECTECWICNEKFEEGDPVTSFLGFGLCHLDCLNNKFEEGGEGDE